MKLLISIAAICLSGAASAQSGRLSIPQTAMTMPNNSTFNLMMAGRIPISETPTMKRQKLARAIALREEAAKLVQEGGGTLTPRQETYLRRKAQAILTGRR